MLLELNVRGLGIIDRTEWSLSPGLNIITGETGAGKSLVIDAVETLLGARVDDEAIRHGSDEATVEGVFAVTGKPAAFAIDALLEEKGLHGGDDTLVIACTVRRHGRSVFRVNGNAVPRSLVHMIGRLLIDIHGQSEHLALLERKYHLDFVDAYGETRALRDRFRGLLAQLREAQKEVEALTWLASDAARREDFLRFQVNEICQADLRDGEEEDLDQERRILSSTEKLKELSYRVYETLSGEDSRSGSTVDRLQEGSRALKELAGLDPRLEQQASLLEESIYGIEEIARDVHSYGDDLEYDPDRLAEVELRLDRIANLKRKYGSTVGEVLEYLRNAESELQGLAESDDRRSELEAECSRIKGEMGRVAEDLSAARRVAAERLVQAVGRELIDLNMAQVGFDVAFSEVRTTETIPLPGGEVRPFGNDGIDSIEFVASTNPGEPLKPLAKIASTGEISRFMLALKGALSEADDIPVVVFDEIDIGVGGRGGEVLGRKLWALARNRQVVCVTHLPQIAAFGDAHYSVHKELSSDRTSSLLERLDDGTALSEIAAMLSGPGFSETALESARELVRKARVWKDGFCG